MANIKGKWRWNDDVDTLPDSIYDLTAEVHFSSNSEEFSELKVEKYAIPLHVVIYYDSIVVQRCLMNDPDDENSDGDYEIDEFLNETYRVMDFGETEQEISDELYAFISANATKPIAEKLVEVANNVEKVFAAGKQQGHGEGYKSGYNAGLEEGKEFGGYNEGYDEGYGKGYSQSESDFWDVVQRGGRRTDYDYAFLKWDSEYIRPRYLVKPTEGAKNIIYDCDKLKKIEAKYFDMSDLPFSKSTLSYCMSGCSALEEIEDIGLQPNVSYEYFASRNPKLKKVACIRLNENSIVSNMLYDTEELVDVTIEGTIGQDGLNLKWSTKLSKNSITSIITHLSDSATGKTLTLSKAAVDKAFETSEGANDGTSSQEWDSLEGLKMNWEITLV